MTKKFNIEIDLEDILYDIVNINGTPEYEPSETLQESIQRQVKTQVIDEIKSSYLKEFKDYLYKTLMSEIKDECKTEINNQIPDMIENVLTREYEKVSTWGSKSETTSFLNEFAEELKKHMKYEKHRYDSDKNVFSRAIDKTIEELCKEWKKDFDEHIKNEVLSEAYRYGLEKISRAFNVSIKDLEDKQCQQ